MSLEALEDRHLLSVGFAPAVTFPVGVHPRAITVADLNNDAVPDIAVVNQGQGVFFESSLSVLLGNGDGSFQPAVTTDVLNPGFALSLAVGDFNGDGLPDVAVTTSSPANPAVEVLLGNGDGSFQQDHLVLGVGQNPLSVAVGDFDGNGALDLVTANSTSGTLSLLLGNGDGSFQPRIDLAVGAAPRAVVVGDFNGDGLLDVVAAQQLSDTVSVLLGHGDGTFAPPLVFAASGEDFTPSSVAVGDVNGDGRADLVINSLSFLESPASQLGVLLGNGDGTFQTPILHFPDGGDGDVVLGDFDNDGLTDAAVVGLSLGVPPGGLRVFLGNGDGTFPQFLFVGFSTGGDNPQGLAAADLNGDGLVDLVAANTSSNTVGVLINNTTVTALSADVNPAVVGQAVLLTARVTGAAGIPTGSVTFVDGGFIALGTATLDDTGTASLAVAFTTAGDHALTAVYRGSSAFGVSISAVLTETVTAPNNPPSLAPIADQTVSSSQQVITVPLSAADPDGDVLSFSATGQSLAFLLNQQAGGLTYHPEFDNFFGAGEKWLLASDNATWYFITSDGTLFQWDGSSSASGTLLGNVGTSYYSDPNQVPAAPADDPRATLTISGDTLTITRDPSFVSGMVITATVSDGHGGSDSKTFTITVT